jgi:hypothetical protein
VIAIRQKVLSMEDLGMGEIFPQNFPMCRVVWCWSPGRLR